MLKLITKIFILLLPVLVALVLYFVCDPFEVIHHYDKHYVDPNLTYNWDYNQTEILLSHYANYPYDSFIFGNSRSRAFVCADWQRYVPSQHLFHYDASAESLYGIYRKLLFLQQQGIAIKNVLMILDRTILTTVANSPGHLYIKHPKVSGESFGTFHMEFLKAYFTPKFILGYFYYKIFHKIPKALGFFDDVFMKEPLSFDPVTGDMFYSSQEREIARNVTEYYVKRQAFQTRSGFEAKMSPPSLNNTGILYLQKIRGIFDAQQTDYRIVISPLYDQEKINTADLNYLRRIFSEKKVFDFSGKNKYTEDMRNYYDLSHYRRHVAQMILAEIYRENKTAP